MADERFGPEGIRVHSCWEYIATVGRRKYRVAIIMIEKMTRNAGAHASDWWLAEFETFTSGDMLESGSWMDMPGFPLPQEVAREFANGMHVHDFRKLISQGTLRELVLYENDGPPE